MAETLINTAESGGIPPSNGSFFHRRIEFLPAKKPFTGFSNGSGGFRLETLNPTASASLRPCSSGQGSGRPTTMGKRSDSLDATEFGLDPELSFGITLRRIGAGLENLGNTCFLNSVLQCLTYTEPLAAYLQSGKHKNSCRKAGFCALCAIQNHVSRALQSTGRSLAPKDLVSNLRCISRNFRNARQEDAHEYMVNLLESMHKCCLPAGVPSESPSAFERSLVHKIFGGRLRSQVKCMQCSFCSDKFDPFLDLSLEINKADSLQKALAHFTAKEYLDGGAREYHCQRCKQKVKALKQLSIHKAPYVLNIHLKRFGSYQPGQKIDRKVQFGLTLDLKPFVTGAYDGDLKYTLYGVLVHYGGNTHSGHYYCFVRTSSGMWYSLDDHKVRHVSEKMVLEEKAYMLFYVRDRKDFAPKKPVDVVQAKSMIINAMGSRIPSDFNQGSKKTVQNGLADKRVESLSPSAALTRLDIAVADTLKENVFKETSVKVNGQGTVAKSSSLMKDAQLGTSSKMPVLTDAVKGLSPLPPNGGECLAQSVVTNGSSGELHNTVFVTTGKEINECNMERSTKENRSEVVEAPDSSYHHNSVANTPKYNEDKAEKDMSDSFAMKSECNGFHSSAGDSFVIDGISLKDSDERESKKINPSSKVEQPRHKNTQIGGLSKESTDGDSGKKMEAIELSKLSGLESTRVLMHQKAPDRSQRKMKKSFLKTQITRTRLSSGILLGAALGLRKKKHKNIKRPPVKIDNLTQEHLLVRKPFPTDLGPSTSEITRALSVCGTVNSQGKASKSSSSKKDDISIAKNEKGSNCHLVEGDADETLRGRVGQNDAVLASDKPPQLHSSLFMAVNGSVGGEGNTLKESSRDSVQNGLMNMLTRGLEETIVARWDGVEHPSSQITETSGVEPVSIGFIGDDWDEEYDKGKRKKLRSSNIDFGGPNPFQEIATQKAKFKKAKVDRSSSANLPFRIRGQYI